MRGVLPEPWTLEPMTNRSKFLRLLLASAPALVAVLLWNTDAAATSEMARKEKKECIVCHTGKGLYSLNETGKYYKQNKALPPAEGKK